MKKKVTCHGPKFTNNQTFLTLELGQYRKSGNTFSSSELVAVRRTAADRPSCARARPQELGSRLNLILQSKLSIVFWNSLWEQSPDDRQRLELGLKLELCHLTNGL